MASHPARPAEVIGKTTRMACDGLALARVNTNAIEPAYRRTDLFERRTALTEQWAAFLSGSADAPGGGANLPS